MWCSNCHQDVPRHAADQHAAGSCPRCGLPVDALEATFTEAESGAGRQGPLPSLAETLDDAALEQILAAPPLPTEDWEFEAELRSVDRLVDRLRRTTPLTDSTSTAPSFSLPTMDGSPMPSAMIRMQAAASASQPLAVGSGKGGLLAWLLLSLGLATFACGGVLLGWSFLGDRADLWSLGMPLILAGQAGLLIGLVLQLEGLWQSNRHTEETLTDLDGKLSQLRHATTMLSTTHSTPGQSFYVHMAEGAHPHLLLADLKGQLDLLAQQMAAQQRGR